MGCARKFRLRVIVPIGDHFVRCGLIQEIAHPHEVTNMPSPKLRRLQDESVTVEKDIENLRALIDAEEDEGKRGELNTKLEERATRAGVIADEAKREHELEAKLDAMRSVRVPGEPRNGDQVQGGNDEKRELPVMGDRVERAPSFSAIKRKAELGKVLCRIAHTGVELRTEMGETSGTYDGAGAELVNTELYPFVINQVNYSSVLVNLAFNAQVNGNKMKLPKFGDITVDYVAENTKPSDQAPTTDEELLEIANLRAWIPVSNDLIEDSPVGVAQLVTIGAGTGVARKIDEVFLTGHVGQSIDGLVDVVEEARTFAIDDTEGASKRDLAQVIGSIRTPIGPTSWIVSQAGYGELLSVYAGQIGSPLVGGGPMAGVINGRPVYVVEGLPEGVLGLYGDFMACCAFGYKPGLRIKVLREIKADKEQTVFSVLQRVAILNHDPRYVAMLTTEAYGS